MSKVELTISSVLEDLRSGKTRKEIGEKYGLNTAQTNKLFNHPKLKGKKTIKFDFELIDDAPDEPVYVPRTVQTPKGLREPVEPAIIGGFSNRGAIADPVQVFDGSAIPVVEDSKADHKREEEPTGKPQKDRDEDNVKQAPQPKEVPVTDPKKDKEKEGEEENKKAPEKPDFPQNPGWPDTVSEDKTEEPVVEQNGLW